MSVAPASPVASSTTSSKDLSIARQRRRRAPAGGASDDCFTCARRQVKCDRRRPYCSPCLEIGNECSGYKTQLTWGVGVASRGKLRGLSLPVAKSPPVSVQAKKVSASRTRANSAATPRSQWITDKDDSGAASASDSAAGDEFRINKRKPQQQPSSQPPQTFQQLRPQLPPQQPLPPAPPQRQQPLQMPPAQLATNFAPYDMPLTPQSGLCQGRWAGDMPFSPTKIPMHIPHMSVPADMLSSSIDTLSDIDYLSPISHSFPGEDIPFLHSPGLMYDGFNPYCSPISQSPVTTMFIDQRSVPTTCPGLVFGPAEPTLNMTHNADGFDPNMSQHLSRECKSLDLDVFSTGFHSAPASWPRSFDEDQQHSMQNFVELTGAAAWSPTAEPTPPQTLSMQPDLLAKMPFFVDYYRSTLCPAMVFIDGPGNPYRDHILQLAQRSQSLRHAICALSACNLRMRRRLSLSQGAGHGNIATAALGTQDRLAGDHSISEEYHHRNVAVQLLNQQLHDPAQSTQDSVIATLLLLCHYRLVESGVSRFQTYFAGVKSIIGTRRAMQPHYQGPRESAWMESIFAYLDAISASVNDREATLNAAAFHVPPNNHLLIPGIENFVGCDRELFRVVGKLGRLHMLSQGRPVQGAGNSSGTSGVVGLGSAMGADLNMTGATVYGAAASAAAAAGLPQQLPAVRASSQTSFDSQQMAAAAVAKSPQQSFPGIISIHAQPAISTLLPTLDNDELPMPTAAVCSASQQQEQQQKAQQQQQMLYHHQQLLRGQQPSPPTTFEDSRSQFDREWHEARVYVQNWEFDAHRLLGSLPGSTTTAQIRDIGLLSEAFRYAALLYLERLAAPSSPSHQANFQNLVSQVVFYATSLEAGGPADRFLLWPLFIAGSECVNELQQNIVRSRCRAIVTRSGYMNNLAALDILERIWAAGTAVDSMLPQTAASAQHGFKWIGMIGTPALNLECLVF